MAEFTYEIVETVAILGWKGSWVTELNIVRWNGGEPKYDIRSWNEVHSKCSKGVSLTDYEAKTLLDALKERLEK